jgi:hypothetical protein
MIELIIKNYDTLIRLFLVAWFISENDYIEAFLNNLTDKWSNILTAMIYDAVTCLYCLCFWSGLIFYSLRESFFDAIFLALFLSFSAWIVRKIAK